MTCIRGIESHSNNKVFELMKIYNRLFPFSIEYLCKSVEFKHEISTDFHKTSPYSIIMLTIIIKSPYDKQS